MQSSNLRLCLGLVILMAPGQAAGPTAPASDSGSPRPAAKEQDTQSHGQRTLCLPQVTSRDRARCHEAGTRERDRPTQKSWVTMEAMMENQKVPPRMPQSEWVSATVLFALLQHQVSRMTHYSSLKTLFLKTSSLYPWSMQ